MTTEEGTLENDFQCSHCEASGELFSSFNREHKNDVKVWIGNLPEGISIKGLRNLFLSVGRPISVVYRPLSNTAVAVFDLMNKAELAVRDLHRQPPYNLKVTIAKQPRIGDYRRESVGVTNSEPWDFSVEDPVEVKSEAESGTVREVVTKTVSNFTYDASVRMRQKMLDFKTTSECVSLGRGYLHMGKDDRFIGCLQKFEVSSESSKARDKMKFHCEKCKAKTTKICGNCNAPYCSKKCLMKSSIDHQEQCTAPRCDQPDGGCYYQNSFERFEKEFPDVVFMSGCTVFMSSYESMQNVFVRRSDGPWEERFARLCNAVALEVVKGSELKKQPQEGEVVAAKYHGDFSFYRARILSKSEGKFLVLFIDFGNTQETGLEDLKQLPDQLKSVPEYAARVRLKNVPEDSSLDSVNYFNKLTAGRIPLVMNFEKSTDEVVLVEKDSNTVVNETVTESALPSWKRDDFTLSKLECEVFWVTHPETEDFHHVTSTMRVKVREYCDLLREDFYLPRPNEVCLAKENDEWHRCVNLQSHKTTCCLFFLDDGHSSFIETKNIRKMVQDFTEAPSQAVCCVLPDDPSLKADKNLHSRVVGYLKESVGRRIVSVSVLKLMGDAYCLSIPRVNEILRR